MQRLAHRRDFLRLTAGALAVSGGNLDGASAWRTFEVTSRVEVLRPSGTTRIWVPAALIGETPYQRTLANRFECEGGRARLAETGGDGLGIISAEYPAGAGAALTVTSRVMTRDWAADLNGRGGRQSESAAELRHYLRPTRMIPTDGIVKDTATGIVRGAKDDLGKARAIYEWIVENTYRNPKTLGCGRGDIRFMLESRDLGGKCADINALYVGLARAAGVPARDVYGIRIARSEMGYKSLGAASEVVTKAQHCRAEVWLSGPGWVAVDPADVRKVMLEEPPGNRPADDEMVRRARARLFGSWEMNWMAYNFAHDVMLPGSNRGPIGFLMYPQAETSEGRLDPLDPDHFRYEVRAREVGEPRG
ncbi:MAG TPA: transglutaminase-like domain-containing protein [Bryobacteraceae bacterium]|nr:transglutaminase-like domain-containing protein [Bryobacteraceae bacterium]